MGDEKTTYTARKLAMVLCGLAGAYCLVRGIVSLPRGSRLWATLFWLGLAWSFVSGARLQWRNFEAEYDEDAAANSDPKHLYQPAVGFTAHPELRRQIAYGMIFSGGGVLFGAFQFLHVGMIFWGAGFALFGVILLFAF